MIDMQWTTVGYPRNTSQKRLEIYWDIWPLSLSLIYIYILLIIIGYDWAMWPRSHGSLFTLTWGYPQRREVFQQLRVHFGMGDDFDLGRFPPKSEEHVKNHTQYAGNVGRCGPLQLFLETFNNLPNFCNLPMRRHTEPPCKPLHPNNFTWHPLGSHASFFLAQRWQCFCGAGTNYSHRDCAGVTTHGRGGGDALGERDTTRVAAKTSTMGCMGSRRSSWEMAPGLYTLW